MLKKKLVVISLILLALMQSCGTFLDLSGKGAKTECLSLDTGKQTIFCNCEEKQISSVTIYKNRNSKENFGPRMFHLMIDPTTKSFKLPVSKDSLDPGFLQIEVHLTDSHWRESYYMKTEPGDFSKSQILYSRYFSH